FLLTSRRPGPRVAGPPPAPTVLRAFVNGTCHRQRGLVPGHAGEALAHAHAFREVLAVALVEQRLVVNQVQLRRSARHEKINDAPGFSWKVRRGKNAFEWIYGFGRRCGECIAVQQAEQSRAAEAKREPAEEFPAVHREIDVGSIHKKNHSSSLIYINHFGSVRMNLI